MKMEDFLGELLNRIENSGASFSERAYVIVGQEILPLLRLMLVAYVAWYGAQLIMGTARLGVGDIILRIFRMVMILVLVGSWGNFNGFVYRWVNNTPEDVGRAILTASGTGISEPTNGMSMIWQTANRAASAFAEQSGYFSILPSMVGILVLVGAGVFIAVALAILILAKVMLWVLLGTAPIFLSCMLFERSRSYAMGWFNQVLTYALIPLFIYVIAAFLIAAMNPELSKIDAASGSRTLTLADTAGFLLLCIAGGFVMLYIQSLGQGIATGIAAGVGNAATKVAHAIGIGIPLSILRGGAAAASGTYRAAGKIRKRSKGNDSDSSGTRSAMQTKIARQGMPS